MDVAPDTDVGIMRVACNMADGSRIHQGWYMECINRVDAVLMQLPTAVTMVTALQIHWRVQVCNLNPVFDKTILNLMTLGCKPEPARVFGNKIDIRLCGQ